MNTLRQAVMASFPWSKRAPSCEPDPVRRAYFPSILSIKWLKVNRNEHRKQAQLGTEPSRFHPYAEPRKRTAIITASSPIMVITLGASVHGMY